MFSSPSRFVRARPASTHSSLTAYPLEMPFPLFASRKSIFGIKKTKRMLDNAFPWEYIADSWRCRLHWWCRFAMSAMGYGQVGVFGWSVAERARCRCLGWSSAGVAWFHLQSAIGAGVRE